MGSYGLEYRFWGLCTRVASHFLIKNNSRGTKTVEKQRVHIDLSQLFESPFEILIFLAVINNHFIWNSRFHICLPNCIHSKITLRLTIFPNG
jgi:hypothetical protein